MLVADAARRWRESRRQIAGESGFTLIELLFVASLSLVIIGGSAGILIAGVKNEPRIAERTADIQAARVTMERLTREIRQGDLVVTATASQLSLVTNVNSATCGGAASSVARPCRVTYTCTAGTCTRRETNPDGSGSATPVEVIKGISKTAPIFTYSPSAAAPGFVGIELVFPATSGDDSITLTDGVTMRNATMGAS